jgi:catechol 2,3-dioxygenase-like lactoylglutathione lyase family enzyme
LSRGQVEERPAAHVPDQGEEARHHREPLQGKGLEALVRLTDLVVLLRDHRVVLLHRVRVGPCDGSLPPPGRAVVRTEATKMPEKTGESTMRVKAFDHLVLNVSDVDRALDFYTGPLGLQPERVEEWRAGKVSFPSVRIDESTVIDLFSRARGESNVDHICLVVDPLDWQEVIDSGTFDVVEGPVPRWGARGSAQSVYVRDPDGNTVELRWYPQDAGS